MTRLLLPTYLVLSLLLGCQDETTSVSKTPDDSSEPEECEPPAEYFWAGCAYQFEDIPEIQGCYIPCLENPCPEGLQCKERTVNPCANLGCQNCYDVVEVCVEP